MTTQYQVRIYSRTGQIQHVVTDMLALSYVREVNAPGLLLFDLRADHRSIADLQLDSQVEVWRRNPEQGIGWYCDFWGFWRGEERRADENGQRRYRAFCPGQMDLLARPIVAYPSEAANRSVWTSVAAETVAKTLVRYNATADGTTADGRVRQAMDRGIALQGDAGRGNLLSLACAWRRLLDVLRDVAELGGGDFDLVKFGATQWEFRWYPGQLGSDRRDSVCFALYWGNIANPLLTRDHMGERTVAIVGGQGQEANRAIVARTGANYDAQYNLVEVFVDRRDLSVTAALQAAGDGALKGLQTRDDMEFAVLQAPHTLYGRHYFLGDLVTGVVEGVAAYKQIRRVAVGLAGDGGETITVEMRNV